MTGEVSFAVCLQRKRTVEWELEWTEVTAMASITIRKLDDDVRTRLRMRAAGNGRSMEEEVRLILRDAVGGEPEPVNLADFIRECFAPYGGVELELPPRGPMREPPRFD